MIDNSKTIPQDKLKDILITKTAIKNFLSEDTVEKIVSHQFHSIREALKVSKEVDISKLGRFTLSRRKIMRRIMSLEKMKRAVEASIESGIDENQSDSTERKLISVSDRLNKLKEKAGL